VDPLTAALNLATEIVKLCQQVIESQPPELRAAIAKQQWEDFQKWREFFERFKVNP
jgi:DNA-binding protein H-NS